MTGVAAALEAIAALIGDDVSGRLSADAASALRGACPDDFRQACLSLAQLDRPALVIVTGFFIPTGQPPGGETDGPLGAIFLARALRPLGMRIVLATDDFCARAMHAGINHCGLRKDVPLVVLPRASLISWPSNGPAPVTLWIRCSNRERRRRPSSLSLIACLRSSKIAITLCAGGTFPAR
jgi:hypothetical protein